MEAAIEERTDTAGVKPGRKFSGAEVWLHPFDELRLGDSFTSRARTVTEADVVQFAALTGDWHPQHTNQVYAEGSIFGRRVAHGMLVMAYAIGLVPNEYVAALRRIRHMVFKHPVFFGDTIHVEGMVVRLQEYGPDLGMVTGRWRVVNQDDVLIMKMELDALWRRDHPYDDADGD